MSDLEQSKEENSQPPVAATTNEVVAPPKTEEAPQVSYKKPERSSSNDFDEEDDKGVKGKDNDKFPKKNSKYKRKVCKFCTDRQLESFLNYKRVDILDKFITNRGKILPRRITGTCAKHQRSLARTIKRSRSINLLPFKVL